MKRSKIITKQFIFLFKKERSCVHNIQTQKRREYQDCNKKKVGDLNLQRGSIQRKKKEELDYRKHILLCQYGDRIYQLGLAYLKKYEKEKGEKNLHEAIGNLRVVQDLNMKHSLNKGRTINALVHISQLYQLDHKLTKANSFIQTAQSTLDVT